MAIWRGVSAKFTEVPKPSARGLQMTAPIKDGVFIYHLNHKSSRRTPVPSYEACL